MQEKMGRWVRKTEGRCIWRDCSIITGLKAEEICKRCWGRKMRRIAEAEEAKESEIGSSKASISWGEHRELGFSE